jgi:hypothetical protein
MNILKKKFQGKFVVAKFIFDSVGTLPLDSMFAPVIGGWMEGTKKRITEIVKKFVAAENVNIIYYIIINTTVFSGIQFINNLKQLVIRFYTLQALLILLMF